MTNFELLEGDAHVRLREMPDQSVHCCVTSPPYFGLRDYGVLGQLGGEPTPEEYVSNIVAVFREVRRVLRDDGTLWVNIGDSYANDAKWGGSSGGKHVQELHGNSGIGRGRKATGLKPKDLVGMPWRVAFALQADGWYLRSDIIWHKPNPMPESVRDRPTKAHEYLFLLAKSERYYYYADAIKEPAIHKGTTKKASQPGAKNALGRGGDGPNGTNRTSWGFTTHDTVISNRNKRTVWTFATLPTPEAHFATFPIELPETCLKAGCPEGGTVLDPFAGAGTTGLACLKNGRKFVGIELKPEYIEIAYSRARKYYPLLLDQGSMQEKATA